MDQTLNLKLQEFEKALTTLKEALDLFDIDNILVRDATIKRFEYSYELCWKTSKVYLKEQRGDLVIAPKECFRALGKHGILAPKEVEIALNMVDDRNETTHAYGERFIRALYPRIKEYFALMNKILSSTKKDWHIHAVDKTAKGFYNSPPT
ncbi:nucleotidyltransferase substrate binding protein [Candidatus Peregrinibacteria bacterium]|nr:nucleotidyltransferase substrate binding protein [Candidatus Peregrinibacteria bacterium]